MNFITFVLLTSAATSTFAAHTRYLPTWESLDTHPIPPWYDEVKFGIFITWGVYAVPGTSNEWFLYNWKEGDPNVVKFMKENYPPDFTYGDFASQFRVELLDFPHWMDVLSASGAKYVVLTTKHCDGYTLWPSKHSYNWNAMDVGPKRDLVGEFSAFIRNSTDIHLGFYHAYLEWLNPLYLADQKAGYKTQDFIREKALPELYELINTYKPDLLWSDAVWEAPYTYWNSTEFLAWLYNDSPVRDSTAVNDRWGVDTKCKHGDFWTCTDRYNPGHLVKHKWENCMTIDTGSWGYRRNIPLAYYMTIEELIAEMAETVSCGGNLLMNIGPSGDGRIIPIFEERLRQMGQWLGVNGEAIYSTKPWSHQNDTVTKNVWYTSRNVLGKVVAYAIVLFWPPQNDTLFLGSPVTTSATRVTMLGYKGTRTFSWAPGPGGSGVYISYPRISFLELPSTWAWVLKLENLADHVEGARSSDTLYYESVNEFVEVVKEWH